MKKPIKLLVLSAFVDGGTGSFVSQIKKLDKLLGKKACLSFAVLRKPEHRLIPFRSKNIYYFRSSQYPRFYELTINNVIIFIKEFIWLKKVIRIENPDLIISIDTHCNLLASVMKYYFFTKMILIISTHNNISAVTEKKLSSILACLLKKVGNFFFKKADRIVCISNGVARDFKSFFSINKEVEVIPYGLYTRQADSLGNKNLSTSDKILFDNKYKYKKVISIGRFEIQKDFDTLIKAFAFVYKKSPHTRLYLIGDGYDKQKLINLTKQLSINNVVHFLGWKQNVYQYLKRSDIFILSSKYEGFGWVLLEAMSQGLPIISTNAPYGPSEVLDNGKYGILVPVGDKKKMAEAMMKLLTNKKLYNHYRKMSLERIKFYSEEKMLEGYKKLIIDLIKKGK